MANPYEKMVNALIEEAEDGIFDDSDELAIYLFSNGESENISESGDIDDDVEDIEDDDELI